MQQHLQDSSSKATLSEQQHQAAVMRLTRDLEQEQTARSDSAALPCMLIVSAFARATAIGRFAESLPEAVLQL